MAIPKFATLRQDHEKMLTFLSFTWERFIEDRCLQTAGALAYTTLFALVPLTAAILGILAAFPVFGEWRDQLTVFVFSNFVPAAGDVVHGYLTEFAANARKATAIGVLVLLVSAIALMVSIEDAFNRIWRVNIDRRATSRFLIYWAALSLGPLLIVAALAISSYVFALPFIDAAAAQFSIKAHVLSLLPFLIVWNVLMVGYMIIPNRGVRFRHAATGALIGAVLFELAKRGFAWYATDMATYQQVYGAVAIVPIFFLWVYLSWIIVLLGASITASLSAFDYRPVNARVAVEQEFAGLLRVLSRFAAAHREGRGLHSSDLRALDPFLTDDLLQRYLGDLSRVAVIRRTENGEWVLARDLSRISLVELYREGDYRLPADRHTLPGDESGIRGPLDTLADLLHAQLDVPLSAVVELTDENRVQSPPPATETPA